MLLDYNTQGLIPGPDEDEATFLKRIAKIHNLAPPNAPLLDPDAWQESHTTTTSLFDIKPSWIIAFYSNKNLPFWQGAATWIEDNIPLLQLKTSFATGSHLKIYHRREILAHEAAHACRMAFNEPKFEEILAYQTSTSPLRKTLGPFFRTSKESYLFLFLLLIAVTSQYIQLWMPNPYLNLLLLLPLLAIFLGALRLTYSLFLFKRCIQKLSLIIKDPTQALAVTFRLTDKEITTFARATLDAISTYAVSNTSLRWQVINRAYF